MLFDGFTDIRGREDGIEEAFNSNPQLKLDIGKFVGYPSIFYAGIEYYHWNNKYGIRGIKERVFSPLVQARYSF